MAVQVSYPGVYVDEFEPGAPIQGVGTSTAAFVGTALSGPIGRPTLIQSWDAFVATFGGFVTSGPVSYLAPAVYGFFLNGGTTCYVVRAGTGQMAEANLDDREAGPNPPAALVATALREGPGGNAISITVDDSSRFADELTKKLAVVKVDAVSADRLTLTVDRVGDFAPGDIATVSKGSDHETVNVDTVTPATSTIVLQAAIPGAVDYTDGTLRGGSGTTPARSAVSVRTAEANVSGMPDRATLTVDDRGGLAPGDRVLLEKGADSAEAAIRALSGTAPATIDLVAPVGGAVDFTGGTVRIADLAVGQTTLRLQVPAALSLNQALPSGSLIRIVQGATSEFGTVASSGGDAITLADGLANGYALDDATNLPYVGSAEFDLTISDVGSGTNESFRQLSMNPSHPNYWGTAVTSTVVTLATPEQPSATPPDDPRPKAATYQLAGGTADDRANAMNQLLANPNESLDTLKAYDDVNLVSVPGVTDKAVQEAVIAHCEQMYDRFAILDSILGATPGNGIRTQFGNVRSEKGFAAFYYPWILVRSPATGKDELWPPCGHIAGVYARTDQQEGVHKAPANTFIRGALGLERRLTNEEQGPLNLMGIDVLRVFPGRTQPVVWGARTTAGDLDRNWQYVNVRRLFIFLEESIQEGIRWAVFEPNNLALWQKLKRSIGEFLTQVWRDGALFGETAADAFYVRIDEALNPASTQALGRLYIEVGVRPTYPAEFIILRIGIWQGGSEVTES